MMHVNLPHRDDLCKFALLHGGEDLQRLFPVAKSCPLRSLIIYVILRFEK